MYKKLTIVSDTAIFCTKGRYFAFGPVVREVESFEHLFEQITWIGYNRVDKINDLSMQEIKSKKVNVVFLKHVGGKTISSFLHILLNYPSMFFTILKNIYKADVVHTRAPSHPALIGVLMSFFFQKKTWWNKYAGNWNQENPSRAYGFQRFILKKATFSKVTINGFWENQPKHCLSFENPCLTDEDLTYGKAIAMQKLFDQPFNFVFVGRLDASKGVDDILLALQEIPINKIGSVHFVGDGPNTENYKNECAFLSDKVVFHGFLDQQNVYTILSKSHFLLLPSKSEGFPKVIAEAACFGVIPIVSNVGSIPHYINSTNGFIWEINSNTTFAQTMHEAIFSDKVALTARSHKIQNLANDFTFIRYVEKLKSVIFNAVDNPE